MNTLRRWNEELGDYEDIEITQTLVEKLRDSAIEFGTVLNNYLDARAKVDPNFKGVPHFSMEGDEDSSFDCLGDVIVIQWKEYGRCGDADYFSRAFPFSDLWNPNWKDRVRAELEETARREKEKREAAALARKQTEEERERKLLQTLQAKYGGSSENRQESPGSG
jgi:hypothetical protein